MKSLIKKILEEKAFMIDEGLLQDQSSLLAKRTENNKFDFLTVMFITKDEIRKKIITEKIEEYLIKIIETQQTFFGIEKNLSLLLLIELDSLSYSKEIATLIYDLEEDPYDFKKYVLTYTKKQVALLESYNDSTEGNILLSLNNILNDISMFSKFKNNEDSDEVLIYDLVSKLFIKIPFLNIENNQQSISNLNEEIVKGIEERDIPLWESLMKLNETTDGNPNIEEILKCIEVESIE